MNKYIIKAEPAFKVFVEIKANNEEEAKIKVNKLMMERYGFDLSQWLEYDVVDKPEEGYEILTRKI